MKLYLLLLLLLLPLCSAKKPNIECYGHDHLMVQNMLLQCSNSKVQQACYTKPDGEKGCTRLDLCSSGGRTCCYTDRCNA